MMARRLFGGFLQSIKFHRLPLPLLSGSDKSCVASFCTSRKVCSNAEEFGQSSNSEDTSKHHSPVDSRLRKFMDPNVQQLLKDLTGLEYEKVFRRRKTGVSLEEPKYKFMTEEQLKEAAGEARAKAIKLLQMPPVLPPRKPINKEISWDPDIQGFEKFGATLLFADITQNRSDRNRIIVARQPDGLLRQASWEERDKMNRIYFPVRGRTIKNPRMFTDPQLLADILKRVETDPKDNVYEFLCDRACIQFEPDDPLYISAVEATYEAMDRLQHYEYLYSTRHYGPMVFYLVRHHKLDRLLTYYIQKERLTEASKLISLFHLLFPECKSAKEKTTNEEEKISKYIELDAVQKSQLSQLFNAYLEQERAKRELEKGLQVAHGIAQ